MKNIILEEYMDISYTLIARYNGESVHEFVAAYMYDCNTDTWAQGHYFHSLMAAVDYIQRITYKCKNKVEYDF